MNNKINFNNKTILITGGAGFIGSNLAFYFQANFPKSKVTVFDCFRNNETFQNGNQKSFGHYNNLIGFRGDIICGNINNKDDLSLLNDYKFDVIFHHAAISDTRIYDQEIIMRTNVNSFYDILELTKNHNATNAEKFLADRGILVRGMKVYGLPNHLRISIGNEKDPTSFVGYE